MTIFRDLSDTRELVGSFTRPAETLFPVSRLHSDKAAETARWANVVEMGWLAIGLPEESGGVGLTLLEEALASQIFGRHLLSSNYPATLLAADGSLRAGHHHLGARLLDGSQRAALSVRSKSDGAIVAFDARPGDLLVVINDVGVEVFESDEIPLHDDVHWGCGVGFAQVVDPLFSVSSSDLVAKAQLVIAGMLAGIASECSERAVEYAKVREQFGQPIGAFQAIKHHCANMAIAAHAAGELVNFAALSMVEQVPDSGHLPNAALNLALRAARDNTGLNIQIHGGMGFSSECDAHLFLKAARILDAAVGGVDRTRQALMAAPQ